MFCFSLVGLGILTLQNTFHSFLCVVAYCQDHKINFKKDSLYVKFYENLEKILRFK